MNGIVYLQLIQNRRIMQMNINHKNPMIMQKLILKAIREGRVSTDKTGLDSGYQG